MENKTIKYFKYAIGEILLVMVGILLALQVNNWRDNILTKKQEVKSVRLLIRDLKADKEELEIFRKILETDERSMKKLLLEIKNNENQDSILKYIRPALRSYLYRPSYPTYKSLVNNNNLGIISDDMVRDSIISYFDGTITYLENLLEKYNNDFENASEAMKTYIGFEVKGDSSWAFTSLHNIEALKNDVKTKHYLSDFGARNSGLGRRIDNIFLPRITETENLLSTYLSEIAE